jgi:nicotinic acid mononucleotide adenylyltransferase
MIKDMIRAFYMIIGADQINQISNLSKIQRTWDTKP